MGLAYEDEFSCRNRGSDRQAAREQFVELERWFDAERNRKWDRQIEDDVRSGKLREAYHRLQSENEAQPNIPLDEFLDDGKLS